MLSVRNIKNRIRSIENTKKVTQAMEMVALAKLNRIDKMLYALRDYAADMEALKNDLLGGNIKIAHPLLAERAVSKEIVLCVITSDNGLCGLYNNNLIRVAEEFIQKYGEDKIKLVILGRKGFNYFKTRSMPILKAYVGLNGRYQERISDEIANYLIDLYAFGKTDAVYLAYTHFKRFMVYEPVIKKFLNLEKSGGNDTDYILEPGPQRIIEEFIPRYVTVIFRSILLEAFTSEHSARTIAMKTSTDNARDLLKKLTVQRNKARQANITTEMLEIISSSEALKG